MALGGIWGGVRWRSGVGGPSAFRGGLKANIKGVVGDSSPPRNIFGFKSTSSDLKPNVNSRLTTYPENVPGPMGPK